MEQIMKCRREDLEDYYGLLGCDELSTTEQIIAEYKVRALSCHPDKHPDHPGAAQNFQKIQQAKDILTDECKRREYDYWLRSGVAVPFSEWQALRDSAKTSMHWAVKGKKQRMLTSAEDTELLQAGSSDTQVPPEEITSEQPSPSSHWHPSFRWAADAPSSLLKKFRNYQI